MNENGMFIVRYYKVGFVKRACFLGDSKVKQGEFCH